MHAHFARWTSGINFPSGIAVNHRVRTRAKFFFERDQKFFAKGVTYGPFAPDAEGAHFGTPEKAQSDFRLCASWGQLNSGLLRASEVVSRSLRRISNLRALISIPWSEHLEFLNDRKVRRDAESAVAEGVGQNAGHNAVFGYLVGNEIPSTMVRWLGPRQVTEFVENLINIGREEDDSALFSYASYPPTEYLLPPKLGLRHFQRLPPSPGAISRAISPRLQNLAEEKPAAPRRVRHGHHPPLRGGASRDAALAYRKRCSRRTGGNDLYAWTDEWFRGGQEITDWAFGLVRGIARRNCSYRTVKELFANGGSMTRKVRLPRYPKVSVIVCSYNGAKTLDRCLESLKHLEYPDYEVILVDDGSKDQTQQIAARHPWVVNIRQENSGLSVARNVGRRAATGEVIAYTDSDCMADPEWLYFMVGTLLSGRLCGRWRTEHFAAGRELDSGLRSRCARRPQPCAPDRCHCRAHSGLQHGFLQMGVRESRWI